ncbi:MAG: S9 family peptidase [Acidobacteriaceae bacterium]|nr:S9 family peptidase [Acidobacteriaceae bacterium]
MRSLRAFSLFLTIAVLIHAAALTPEQALKVRRISELTFSPDAVHLACTVEESPKGADRARHIWLLDTRTGEFRQFTFSPKTEHMPRWSPDGHTLAFLSDRAERNQIYTIRLDGGEALAITSGKNAITAFHWSPDGKHFGFLAAEPKSDADEKKEKDKDDARVYDREQELARFWTVDADGKNTRQITKGAWKIDDFEWLAPDRIIAVASDQPRVERWIQALYTVSVADGKFTKFGEPKQPFGGLNVSPDQKFITFSGTRDEGPMPHNLYLTPASAYSPRDITASIDRPVFGIKWQNNSTAVISVVDGFRTRLYRVDASGSVHPIELSTSVADYAISSGGTLAYVAASFDHLPELWLQPSSGPAHQVSHLQEGWDAFPLANAEIFKYKSFDGRTIEAAFLKPTNVTAAPDLPLILYVHGGPAGAFQANFYPWAQLLAAHGYAVVMPNPRGSIGYGEEFLKANRADWGGGDFRDVMAAVDAVLARGGTDPHRLGIAGWSYGGYMAEWAITQTGRFKAAVCGAGMFDLAAEYGTENGPEGDEWYYTTPWEHPERFYKSSPVTYIKNAKTPTLILQGENDPVDPLGQSTALYRALKRYNVETELVVYPREPHGPREEKHQLDILTRMLGWFEKYLSSVAPDQSSSTQTR